MWSIHSQMPLWSLSQLPQMSLLTIWSHHNHRSLYFPSHLSDTPFWDSQKKISVHAQEKKNIAIRMILLLHNNKFLMLLDLTWLRVTSSKRGANWETTLPANSVQLMHYLLTMINWSNVSVCDEFKTSIFTTKKTKQNKNQAENKNVLYFYFKWRLLFLDLPQARIVGVLTLLISCFHIRNLHSADSCKA